MHHAIVGPGGVGGLIGGCLAKFGEAVTTVVRPEAAEKYPHQLTVESTLGNFTAPIKVSATVPACDVVWIAVKTTQLETALASFHADTEARGIVPLQNGIDHVALLRRRYGSERVFPGTFAGESERVAAGHIAHRSPFARLQLIGSGRPLLAGVLEQFRQFGFMVDFIDDEATLLWSKLVILAPLALTTSAADASIGEMASNPDWRARLEACVREACAVAIAEGAHVNADVCMGLIGKLPYAMRSSMQKDLEQGNPVEVDAIGGPILRASKRHGIPVPVTQSLVEMVTEKTQQAT
jgi:2-dehydropantoate 2-reductase